MPICFCICRLYCSKAISGWFEGWLVGWKSPGDCILRAPAVLINEDKTQWFWQIFIMFSSCGVFISGGDRIDQDFNLLFHQIGQGQASQSWNKSNLEPFLTWGQPLTYRSMKCKVVKMWQKMRTQMLVLVNSRYKDVGDTICNYASKEESLSISIPINPPHWLKHRP